MVFSHAKRCPWAFLPLSLMFFFSPRGKRKSPEKNTKILGKKRGWGSGKIFYSVPLFGLPARAVVASAALCI